MKWTEAEIEAFYEPNDEQMREMIKRRDEELRDEELKNEQVKMYESIKDEPV